MTEPADELRAGRMPWWERVIYALCVLLIVGIFVGIALREREGNMQRIEAEKKAALQKVVPQERNP